MQPPSVDSAVPDGGAAEGGPTNETSDLGSASPAVGDGDANADAGQTDGGESEAGAAVPSPGPVDPAVSKQWSWQSCGTIPPTPLAIQAEYLPDSDELVVWYADGSILVHAAGGGPPVRQLVGPIGASACPDGPSTARCDWPARPDCHSTARCSRAAAFRMSWF